VYRLAELLSEQRAATRENVQRKQAQTGEEREEDEEENYPESDSSDDEDDIPYNPKNLPLGWDGKVGMHEHLTHVINADTSAQKTKTCTTYYVLDI
jgi:splicing factor 3A subunit 3